MLAPMAYQTSIAPTRAVFMRPPSSPKIVLLVMKGTDPGFSIAATAARGLTRGLLLVEQSPFSSS